MVEEKVYQEEDSHGHLEVREDPNRMEALEAKTALPFLTMSTMIGLSFMTLDVSTQNRLFVSNNWLKRKSKVEILQPKLNIVLSIYIMFQSF